MKHSPVIKPGNIPHANDNLIVRFHSGVNIYFDAEYISGATKPNFTLNGIEYTVSGGLEYNPITMNFEANVYDLYASRAGNYGSRDLTDSAKAKFKNEILPALSAWVKTQHETLLEANRVKTQNAIESVSEDIDELNQKLEEKIRELAELKIELKTNFAQVPSN